MNALLLRNLQMRRASSLQSFKEYRALEAQNPQQSSVTSDGALLEFETLELRLHPPNVVIDNDSYDDMTVITIDSANRPGTLIEVVQCLTELNLSIRKARISSDGGWFVDEFFVTETPRGKVLHQHKLELIKRVLSVGGDSSLLPNNSEPVAVFELSGRDQRGLLANVLSATVNSGCDVQSLAVWTYHNQVALVMAVADRGHQHAPSGSRLGSGSLPNAQQLAMARIGSVPGSLHNPPGHDTSNHSGSHHPNEPDPHRMSQLSAMLVGLLGGEGQAHGAWEVVVGEVHHERRLHHLLLAEEERSWEAQLLSGQTSLVTSMSGSSPLAGLQASLNLTSGPSQPAPGSRTGSVHSTPVGAATASNTSTPAASHDPASAATTPTADFSPAQLPPPLTTPSVQQGATATLLVAHGTAPESPTAPSTFATLQSQQQVAELGGLDTSQNGEDHAALEFARVRSAHQGSSAVNPLSLSGSGPLPYFPAPTAIPASDFLNMHAYMDPASAAHLLRADVRMQHSPLLKYYLVTITCKDRNKLFFDTVCTLADMQYDVYHGAIDSEGDQASQLFYVRPRSGELVLDETRVRQLSYMLECAVQRRFPRGLRVHLQTHDRKQVPGIFAALANAGLSITRAEVRTLGDSRSILDLTLTDGAGQAPPVANVQKVCESAGGMQADELDPLMAVAGVGGAAVAAATNMRMGGLLPTPSGMYGIGTQLHAAHPSTAAAGASILSLPPTAAGARSHHSTSQVPPNGANHHGAHGMPMAAPRYMHGKFQFAIPGSAERHRRGPMSVSSTATGVL